MLIETQRLILRDISPEDGIPFAEMAADGSLTECGLDRDCGSWMARWLTEAETFALRDDPRRDYLAYTIALKKENTVVGSVGCSWYEDLHETGITYFVGAEHRNNGYAHEAAAAYIRYFFNHYNLQRMIATVRAGNLSSISVAERVGFTLTEKRMYRDLNDDGEKLYHFYEITGQR